MILAAYQDTPYNVILLLHILTRFVAFSPAFVHPFLENDTRGDGSFREKLFTGIAARGMKIYGSALIIGGLLGFGLAGMSGDGTAEDELIYRVSDGWILTAVIIWVAMNGVLHGMILKGEKAIAAGDESATKTVMIGGQLITVMFLVTMWLMVFKPGA